MWGGWGVGRVGRLVFDGVGGEVGMLVFLQSEEEQDEGDDVQQCFEYDGVFVWGEVIYYVVEVEGDGFQILI